MLYSYLIPLLHTLPTHTHIHMHTDDGKKVMLDVEGKSADKIHSELAAIAGKTE